MALPAVLQSARGRASHRLIRCFTQTAWPHIRTETSEQQPPMSGVVGVSGRDAVRDSTQGPPASTSGRPWLPGLQPTTAGLRCFHASLRQGAEEQGSGGQQGLPPLPTHDVLYYGPLSKTHSLLKVSQTLALALTTYVDSARIPPRAGEQLQSADRMHDSPLWHVHTP